MIAPFPCRVATALLLLLAAFPAAAQTAPAGSAAAEASEPEVPRAPAKAPPRPAELSAAPRPSEPAVLPALVLSPDFTRLPVGGWRLGGRAGRGEADDSARAATETIGRYLAGQTTGRVTVIAQVAGPADDPSVARRTSLARAVSVKEALVRGGVPGTRIDLRPMGRTPEALDALDILAPPAPRAKQPAALPPAAQPTPAQPTPARAAAPARPPAGSPARPAPTSRGG